jgi:hypothetical protein
LEGALGDKESIAGAGEQEESEYGQVTYYTANPDHGFLQSDYCSAFALIAGQGLGFGRRG